MPEPSKFKDKTAMKNGRRPVPEFHPPHWSPVMAMVFLVTLGIVAAVIR